MKRIYALCLCGALSACAADTSGPAPVYNAALETHNPNLGAHMVESGESLQQIAANYKVSIDDIMRANNLNNPGQVGAGARLYLPDSPTLSSLANAGPVQSFTQRSGMAGNASGISMTEAQPLTPAPTASLEPIKSETLAPLDDNNSAPAVTASLEPLKETPKTLAQPTAPAVAKPVAQASEPVKLASSLPPEQWSNPLASGFRWPVKGPTLSGYGDKADGLRNDGINIGALEGSAVEAAADGEIVYTGQAVDGFGNLVLMKHKDGFVTAYGHLSRIDVAKGQTIKAGQIIGGVGKTGSVNAPQLHFEIRKGSEILNPSQYLQNGMPAKTAGL